MKIKSIALVLIGIVLGCGAAAVSPIVHSNAQAKAGWGCYVPNKFPDLEQTAYNLDDMRSGMNQIAPNTPSGTITTFMANGNQIICVKR